MVMDIYLKMQDAGFNKPAEHTHLIYFEVMI